MNNIRFKRHMHIENVRETVFLRASLSGSLGYIYSEKPGAAGSSEASTPPPASVIAVTRSKEATSPLVLAPSAPFQYPRNSQLGSHSKMATRRWRAPSRETGRGCQLRQDGRWRSRRVGLDEPPDKCERRKLGKTYLNHPTRLGGPCRPLHLALSQHITFGQYLQVYLSRTRHFQRIPDASNMSQTPLTCLQRLKYIANASPTAPTHSPPLERLPTSPAPLTRPQRLECVPAASNVSPTPTTPPLRIQHIPYASNASNASPKPPTRPRRLHHIIPHTSNASPTPPVRTHLLRYVPYTSNASHMPILRLGSTLDLDEDMLPIEVDGDENCYRTDTEAGDAGSMNTRRFTWPIVD
ncbi:hypothetical protein OG21DRAFT_919175 [Imleria badia]|nr:hypothetical protein OG21DRAFT_919175 [Imleria badia]